MPDEAALAQDMDTPGALPGGARAKLVRSLGTDARSLAQTIFLGIGGRGSLMAVNMLVLVWTSRLVSPADFGRFVVAQLFVDLAAAASYALVAVPILKSRRLGSLYFANAFAVTLMLGIGIGVSVAIAAPAIERWAGIAGLAPLLLFAALIVPLRCMAGFFVGTLQRHRRVKEIVWAQTRSQIASALGVTLVCALLGFGAWSFLFGLAAATLLELLLCIRASRVWPPLALGREARQVMADGSGALSGQLLLFFSDSIDRMAIGSFFGASPLGIYSRAANLVTLPYNLLGIPAVNALMSWFSNVRDKPERMRHALSAALSMQGFLLFPVTAGFCLASPLIVRLLLGPQWTAAIPIAQVLFIGGFARLGAIVLDTAALTSGHAWGAARRQLLSTASLVAGLTIAMHWSLLWAAVAVSASRVIYYCLNLRFGVRAFGIAPAPVVSAHLKGLLVALAGSAVAFGFVPLLEMRGEFARNLLLVVTYGIAAGALTLVVLGNWSILRNFPRWLRTAASR